MKPIHFEQQNITFNSNHPDIADLPAMINRDTGIVSTLWKLSFMDRIKALWYGKIWCQQMVGENQLQPQKIQSYK